MTPRWPIWKKSFLVKTPLLSQTLMVWPVCAESQDTSPHAELPLMLPLHLKSLFMLPALWGEIKTAWVSFTLSPQIRWSPPGRHVAGPSPSGEHGGSSSPLRPLFTWVTWARCQTLQTSCRTRKLGQQSEPKYTGPVFVFVFSPR